MRVMAIAVLFLLAACAPTHHPAAIANEMQTLTGVIVAHQQAGTDGDVWIMQTEAGKRYEVLLSIPNLGELYSQTLADVQVGARIEVSGELWRLHQLERMTARSLLVLP